MAQSAVGSFTRISETCSTVLWAVAVWKEICAQRQNQNNGGKYAD